MTPTRTPRSGRRAAPCTLSLAGLTLALAAVTLWTPAPAQPAAPAHPPGGRAPGKPVRDRHVPLPKPSKPPADPAWHGDIRQFGDHDWDLWRAGRWVHGPHAGHPGWWWVVGSTWYFYPSPSYPYPNPFEPAPPWSLPMPAPGAPPARFWYFCDELQRYYPYVATCPGNWRQVPATQAPAGSAPGG